MKFRWRDQIADGRVFELRSRSAKYPAPCALIVNAEARGFGNRVAVLVDRFGVVGHGMYARGHNPNIWVEGIRIEQFTSKRIARRRPDLERFDADDLKLIRYGCALDFNGRIHGSIDQKIPSVVAADWTVFWLPAEGPHDSRMMIRWSMRDEIQALLHGAWHFEKHGGPRHLGYRFGHCWATRHTGRRLNEIRRLLRAKLPDVIDQPVRVMRLEDEGKVCTFEVRRECPPLGYRWMHVEDARGNWWGSML